MKLQLKILECNAQYFSRFEFAAEVVCPVNLDTRDYSRLQFDKENTTRPVRANLEQTGVRYGVAIRHCELRHRHTLGANVNANANANSSAQCRRRSLELAPLFAPAITRGIALLCASVQRRRRSLRGRSRSRSSSQSSVPVCAALPCAAETPLRARRALGVHHSSPPCDVVDVASAIRAPVQSCFRMGTRRA